MRPMSNIRKTNVRSGKEEGATLVEYGLIVGLISIAAITAIAAIGGDISGFFTEAQNTISAEAPGTS